MDNDFMELYKGYTDEQYNDLADMSYLEEFMESKKKPSLLEDRAFLFQSSYRKSYWTLKKHDPRPLMAWAASWRTCRRLLSVSLALPCYS